MLKATLLYQDEIHNEMVQTAVAMAAGHAQVHLPAAINPHLAVHVYALLLYCVTRACLPLRM